MPSLAFLLADAVQMPLQVSKTGSLSGEGRNHWKFNGYSVDLPMSVHSGRDGDQEAWLLARVKGDLWLLVIALAPAMTMLCILDSASKPMTPIRLSQTTGMSAKEIVDLLQPNVARLFISQNEESWISSANIADLVDGRHTRVKGTDKDHGI